MAVAAIFGQAVLVWLAVDFLSGVFHWLEDAYGSPFWPVVGRHVTKPNILHHYVPRSFVTNSWYLSSRLLLLICSLLALTALALDVFSWQVALGLLIGVNANQVHKWSHRTRHENGPIVVFLQRAHLVQSPSHHHRHHIAGKDSHYCVLTDFLNPVLDGIGFWRGVEWVIFRITGVRRRNDEAMAEEVLRREPEFYGVNTEVIRQRVALARGHHD